MIQGEVGWIVLPLVGDSGCRLLPVCVVRVLLLAAYKYSAALGCRGPVLARPHILPYISFVLSSLYTHRPAQHSLAAACIAYHHLFLFHAVLSYLLSHSTAVDTSSVSLQRCSLLVSLVLPSTDR